MKNNIQKSMVSIIMSSYNDQNYIIDAIKSILIQTYTNWELIIIDDFSSDETSHIINTYVEIDKRIKLIQNTKNMGLVNNLNLGIELSNGEFIARLDSDDVWLSKEKLEKQINFLIKNKDYVLIGTLGYNIDTKGQILFAINYPNTDKAIRNYLLIENCFIHSSVVIRKDYLKNIYYDNNYSYAEDYELWLRIGKYHKFYNLPYYMVGYRINPEGISKKNYKLQLQQTDKIIKKYRSFYPNFIKGYFLWKLRSYFPLKFRKKMASKILKIINK